MAVKQEKKALYWLLPTGVLLVGVVLSLLAWRVTTTLVVDRMHDDFSNMSNNLGNALQEGINTSLSGLKSNARTLALYDTLSRSDFQKLSQIVLEEQPELQALEWVPRVPHRLREAYEEAARRDGFRSFVFTDRNQSGDLVPSAERDFYYPVYYIEPLQGNEEALGYSTGSPYRQVIIEQALINDTPVATDIVSLVQEKKSSNGILLFCPVGPSLARSSEGPETAAGLLEAVYKIDEMVASFLVGQEHEGLVVNFIGQDDSLANQLPPSHGLGNGPFFSHLFEPVNGAEVCCVHELDMGGRRFLLVLKPDDEFSRSYPLYIGFVMLLTGLAFSTVCALFLFFYLNRNRKISWQVRRQTEDLIRMNSNLKEALKHKQEAQEELQMLAETLRNIVEGVVVSDYNGHVRFMNHAAEALFGCRQGEQLGKNENELLDRARMELKGELKQEERHGEEFLQGESLLKDFGGKSFLAHVSVSRIHTSDPHSPLSITLVRDVSVQHNLERQLLNAHKMEAIGQLAGGVAHDFNNILTAIHGSSQLLALRLKDPANRSLVDDIMKTGERAATLVRQLLDYGRPGKGELTPQDLNNITNKMSSMLDRLIPGTISLEFSGHANLPLVMADRTLLEQVLLNLILNARDALKGKGWIRVSTELARESSAPVLKAVASGQPFVRLRVVDNGSGMPQSVRDRIFEPFFTTKKERGNGMGLATVYNIVRNRLNGAIVVNSEPGAGTEFIIDFPALGEQGTFCGSVDGQGEGQVPNPRVLVVEDEKEIRDLIGQVLINAGYTTSLAESADQALRLLDRSHFDLMLTDIVMPGMNGVELGQKTESLHPEMKVLYMSGYASENLNSGNAFQPDHFIQKPFLPSALTGRVRKLLYKHTDSIS